MDQTGGGQAEESPSNGRADHDPLCYEEKSGIPAREDSRRGSRLATGWPGLGVRPDGPAAVL